MGLEPAAAGTTTRSRCPGTKRVTFIARRSAATSGRPEAPPPQTPKRLEATHAVAARPTHARSRLARGERASRFSDKEAATRARIAGSASPVCSPICSAVRSGSSRGSSSAACLSGSPVVGSTACHLRRCHSASVLELNDGRRRSPVSSIIDQTSPRRRDVTRDNARAQRTIGDTLEPATAPPAEPASDARLR